MKKLSLALLVTLSLNFLNAQQLNNNGLYVNSDGELFSGVLTSGKDGVKTEVNVKNGIMNGIANYYFPSGKVMETGFFANGQKDQKWTRYTENGSISAIGFYNAGKKNGKWVIYDDSGKKRFEMNYTNGEKAGTWTNWDENGVVVNTKDYGITN